MDHIQRCALSFSGGKDSFGHLSHGLAFLDDRRDGRLK